MRTIVALATPLMNCAIHIIRVSGPDTFKCVQKICQKTINKKTHTIQRNFIVDKNQNVVDDVLLNIFVKPTSYTGEDTIEINCHGGVIVAKKIIDLLVINGCEHAQRGEFSQQAYLNHKISYLQIEGINNLINAQSEIATEFAIKAVMGNQTKINELREQLFNIVGSIEVNIDYPEYDDVPQMSHEQIHNTLTKILNDVKQIILQSNIIAPVFNGLNVAIIGKPNVGKSSLLNCLIKEDKAIVSDIKGTTRDIVEAQMTLNGIKINFLDTAGIHESDDEIEMIGIKKSKEAINKADIIFYLIENNDVDEQLQKLCDSEKIIKVHTKSDKYKYDKNVLSISVKNNDITNLLNHLQRHISKIKEIKSSQFVLQSNRQITIMEKIATLIEHLLGELKIKTSLDLLQADLEQCLLLFNQLLGISFEYDKLDELFAKFCLGK